MKKEDIETGMLVQFKRGKIFMCIGNTLVNDEGFLYLQSADDYPRWSIEKVSEVLCDRFLTPKYWNEDTLNEFLLWSANTIVIDGIKYSEDELRSIIKKVYGENPWENISKMI